MPVSPTQKQDLMLIKDAFEKKALEQNTEGATWLPMVTTVQKSRRVHEVIRDEAKRYPAATYRNQTGSEDQSFLKQRQIECIPCLGRIKALGDLDMADDLFATLLTYNDRALKNMLNLFKSVSRPNRIQENLCASYKALRSQCIPDIARLLTQLTLLMNYLRSFSLRSLKDQLIGLVGALIVRSLVFGAINYDMYISLITDVTRCIANDINTQLGKLEPILSREGLEDIASLLPLDTQDGELTRREAADKLLTTWFPNQGDFNYAQTLSNTVTASQELRERTLEVPSSVGTIIKDLVEQSISVVDNKLDNATSELLKFLKISDNNIASQIELIDQIQLIRSVLEVLKTIKDTRGDFNPCGEDAGRRFFSRIKFPGQKIVVDNSDPNDPELIIVPPSIKIDNPVVENILNDGGIQTGPVEDGEPVTAGRVVNSIPISINISACIDGKQ